MEPETDKLKLYLTTASPVVTYGNVCHGFKVIRRVYGSKYKDLVICFGGYDAYRRRTITSWTHRIAFQDMALVILSSDLSEGLQGPIHGY